MINCKQRFQEAKGILFDLDGTLIDTAAEITESLNQLLKQHQLPGLTVDQVRERVSEGTSAWLEMAFSINKSLKKYSELNATFLEIHHSSQSKKTVVFPHVFTLLESLDKRKIPWGIVTNKSSKGTKHVLDTIHFPFTPRTIICGDTLEVNKPHPAPLLFAAEQLSVPAHDCVMIGDSNVDVTAGKRANMRTIAVLYGYYRKEEDPKDWEADYYIESMEELI